MNPERRLQPSAYTESRRKKTARKYRTQCKVCGYAIYMDDPATWHTSPMGLSHEGCKA